MEKAYQVSEDCRTPIGFRSPRGRRPSPWSLEFALRVSSRPRGVYSSVSFLSLPLSLLPSSFPSPAALFLSFLPHFMHGAPWQTKSLFLSLFFFSFYFMFLILQKESRRKVRKGPRVCTALGWISFVCIVNSISKGLGVSCTRPPSSLVEFI